MWFSASTQLRTSLGCSLQPGAVASAAVASKVRGTAPDLRMTNRSPSNGVSPPLPLPSGPARAPCILVFRTPRVSQSLISGMNPANKTLLVSDSEQ